MIPYEFDAERFSRWMAYVLRHNPGRYSLETDAHGFVDAERFLQVACRRYPGFSSDALKQLIEGPLSQRFELREGRLRARYGHSIPVEPFGSPVEPPERLYHGTDASRSEAILADGLLPVDRRMVHLSGSLDEAVAVARRHTEQPAILEIRALEAHRQGVAFYHEGKVYLAQQIPPRFLTVYVAPLSPELQRV